MLSKAKNRYDYDDDDDDDDIELTPADLAAIERLRQLREKTTPESARRFLESLPEIDDSADTLAISFSQLRGLKKPKPRSEEPKQDE